MYLFPAQIPGSQTEPTPPVRHSGFPLESGQFRVLLRPQVLPDEPPMKLSDAAAADLAQKTLRNGGTEGQGSSIMGSDRLPFSSATSPLLDWSSPASFNTAGNINAPAPIGIRPAPGSGDASRESAAVSPGNDGNENNEHVTPPGGAAGRRALESAPVAAMPAFVSGSDTSVTNVRPAPIQPVSGEKPDTATSLDRTAAEDTRFPVAIDLESSPPLPGGAPIPARGRPSKPTESQTQSSAMDGQLEGGKRIAAAEEQSVPRSPGAEPTRSGAAGTGRASFLRGEKKLAVLQNPATGLPSHTTSAMGPSLVASSSVTDTPVVAEASSPGVSSDVPEPRLAGRQQAVAGETGLGKSTHPAVILPAATQALSAAAPGMASTTERSKPATGMHLSGITQTASRQSGIHEENAPLPGAAVGSPGGHVDSNMDKTTAGVATTSSAAGLAVHGASNPAAESTAFGSGIFSAAPAAHPASGITIPRASTPATHPSVLHPSATFEQLDSAPSPRLIEGSSQRLTVGVRTPGLGWVEIRTSNTGGRVAATLATGSSESHAAVAAQLPAIRQYLAGEHVRMDSLSSEAFSPSSGGRGGSAGDPPRNSGSQNIKTHAAVPSTGPSPEDAEMETLSYISVRA